MHQPGMRSKSWFTRVPKKLKIGLVALMGLFLTTFVGLAATRAFDRVLDTQPIAVSTEGLFELVPWVVPESTLLSANRSQDVASLCGDFRHRVRNAGGVPTATSFLFFVEGRSDRPVTIDRVRVVVDWSEPPLKGVSVQCAAAYRLPVRGLRVTIRTDHATIEFQDGPDPRSAATEELSFRTQGSTKRPFLFTVSKNEVEAFSVDAAAPDCLCRWHLELGFSWRGKRHTMDVTNQGKPFETTAGTRARPAPRILTRPE